MLPAEHLYQTALRACMIDPDEKRSEPRVVVDIDATIVIGSLGMERPSKITLSDISPGGVGFLSDESLAVGEWAVIHLPMSGECHTPILIEIRHCRQIEDGRFRLGARFLADPLDELPRSDAK